MGKEIKNAYRLRVHEYDSENSFDKVFKIQLLDKEGNELLLIKDIKGVEFNFEHTWRNYEMEISNLKTKIEVYEHIIDKFNDRLNVTYKKESEE